MIVAGPEGFMKNAYRKFNIRGCRLGNAPTPTLARGGGRLGATAIIETSPAAGEGRVAVGSDAEPIAAGGDDYAMMREVLRRRFARALKEDPERERGTWPDLVLIDGGAGPAVGGARECFAELGIDDLPLVGIAKGPDRNAGRERFFLPGRPPFSLEPRDPVLYFLQRLRDEAHRFAIGTHRARRAKAIGQLAARRDRRHRRPAQARAAAPFRLGPRRRARRARRARARRRHQQSGRKKGL